MFGLGFLNSVFLFALGATLVPIIIHILNRRRIKKIRFSSLEFIDEVSKRRMRKVNLRRWIILALRTLAILFLVLAFCRPVLRSMASLFLPGRAPLYVVICLDASYSMGVEKEKGTAFTRAQAIAKEVVDQCRKEDTINLITFSKGGHVWFERGTRNRELVKRAIDQAELTQGGTSIEAAIRLAADQIQSSSLASGEVYVISDFRDTRDTLAIPESDKAVRLVCLPVYREAVDNVTIDRVLIPRKLLRPEEVFKIGVVVTNHSRENEASFLLEIVVDGKRKAEKQIILSPVSTTTQTFPLTLKEWGTYRCRAAKNRDRLPLDDDRYFLLDVSKSVPVTVVRGMEKGDAAGFGGSFYIGKALNPRGDAEGEFRVRHIDERDVTASDLPAKGVVVWVGPRGTDSGKWDLVERYVDRGGALMVFLDPGSEGAFADRSFARFIGAARNRSLTVREGIALTSLRSEHPVLSLFSEEELELLSRTRIHGYLSVDGVDPDSVLAFAGSGDPLIWECSRGRGSVIVVATTPDLIQGDLPLSPMFLPLIHTSVSYLAGIALADVHDETYVNAPLHFDIPPGKAMPQEMLWVGTDQGDRLRPLVAAAPHGGVRATCIDPPTAGFYSVLMDSVVLTEAAVNVDPVEGNLAPYPLERTAGRRASVIDTGSDFLSHLEEARQGREVYAIFLFLALAALAAESILGRQA